MYTITLVSDSPITVQTEDVPQVPTGMRMTYEDLKAIAPKGNNTYIKFLTSDKAQDLMQQHGVLDNPLRLSHFLGQVGAETGGFQKIRESGMYSEKRLRQIFPKYFSASQAKKYANNPEAILSRAYANRLGNGSEASGDGWKYRGYGWLQVTGRDNYERFGITPTSNMLDLLDASLNYWTKLDLNKYADKNDRLAISRGVNVGRVNSSITPNGMSHRKLWFNRSWPVLRKYEKENPING